MPSLPRRPTPELKRRARTFVAGAAMGFVAGAFVVSGIVWQYGNVIGSRAARLEHPANPPPATARWRDRTEDADTPVLEHAEPAPVTAVATTEEAPAGTAGGGPAIGPAPDSPAELEDRDLAIPVDGIKREQLTRSFADMRGSARRHQAIDILAPRNTPVKAVDGGTIARLFYSKAGGITIYQFDPTDRYCYYYAHLERYADGLREGERVRKGQVIAYVGVSGNAPKDTPHLHFAVFRLTAEKRWWEGTPIDPYDVLR
jgi:murein DD-endopeptidase MepM/ murein hydrolase activator NlpD